MKNTKKGVANYATSKANPGPKTADEAAKNKEVPSTTEQAEDQQPDETPVEQTPAFVMGREAKRHGINKLDAPFADGDDKDAWLRGYDFEPDQI